MRIRSYFYYIASNDVESQRKGMVAIAWAEGDFTNTPMPLRSESRRLYRCLLRGMPIRRAAVHFCVPDNLYFRLLSSFYVTVIDVNSGSDSLPRHRFHVGTFIDTTENKWCSSLSRLSLTHRKAQFSILLIDFFRIFYKS